MENDIRPPERQFSPVLASAVDEGSAFQTPETVAAQQTLQEDAPRTAPISPGTSKPAADGGGWRGWFKKLDLQWPPRRKEWLLIGGAVLLIGASVAALMLTHHPKAKPIVHHAIVKKVVKPAAPTTVPSTLTGLPVAPAINQLPVTAVMIENSLDARPQSGLSQAGVVFEAIAEGGITRFLTLFQDTAPEDIGPIRSARPYYIEWAMGFDAGYAHVGGSPEALADIKAWGVKDLDQFANGGSYHRISARAAPHNVYTGIGTLQQLETAKGYTTSTYTGFARKAKEAPSKKPTAKGIDIPISGPAYNVHYDYNPVTNSYNRSEGGAAHVDANGAVQISPKVVIALVMSYGLEADDHHSQYGTLGSGQAYIFQDGIVTIGQWTKATDKDQFVFTDASGKPVPLNPGQTWLTAIANSGGVTYAP